MSSTSVNINEQAKLWLDKGLSDEQIKTELLGHGIDERNLTDIFKEVVKLRRARNTAKGLYFILAGALLCLLSCIFTLTSSNTDVGLMLYGVTSLGIIIVFIGLIKIFG